MDATHDDILSMDFSNYPKSTASSILRFASLFPRTLLQATDHTKSPNIQIMDPNTTYIPKTLPKSIPNKFTSEPSKKVVRILVVGKPGVGKSSLVNALLFGQENEGQEIGGKGRYLETFTTSNNFNMTGDFARSASKNYTTPSGSLLTRIGSNMPEGSSTPAKSFKKMASNLPSASPTPTKFQQQSSYLRGASTSALNYTPTATTFGHLMKTKSLPPPSEQAYVNHLIRGPNKNIIYDVDDEEGESGEDWEGRVGRGNLAGSLWRTASSALLDNLGKSADRNGDRNEDAGGLKSATRRKREKYIAKPYRVRTFLRWVTPTALMEIIDCAGVPTDGTWGALAEVRNRISKKQKDPVIDLVLYVGNLADTRLDKSNFVVMDTITELFGERMWRRALCVLTHGQTLPPARLTYYEFVRGRRDSIWMDLMTVVRPKQVGYVPGTDSKDDRTKESGVINEYIYARALDTVVVELSPYCQRDSLHRPILPDGTPWLDDLFDAMSNILVHGSDAFPEFEPDQREEERLVPAYPEDSMTELEKHANAVIVYPIPKGKWTTIAMFLLSGLLSVGFVKLVGWLNQRDDGDKASEDGGSVIEMFAEEKPDEESDDRGDDLNGEEDDSLGSLAWRAEQFRQNRPSKLEESREETNPWGEFDLELDSKS